MALGYSFRYFCRVRLRTSPSPIVYPSRVRTPAPAQTAFLPAAYFPLRLISVRPTNQQAAHHRRDSPSLSKLVFSVGLFTVVSQRILLIVSLLSLLLIIAISIFFIIIIIIISSSINLQTDSVSHLHLFVSSDACFIFRSRLSSSSLNVTLTLPLQCPPPLPAFR